VNHSTVKCKSGSGPYVINGLLYLANEALRVQGFDPKPAKFPDPDASEEEVEILDEDNEVDLEKIEEELDEIYSSDEDDNDGAWVQQSAEQELTEQVTLKQAKSHL